MAKQKNGPNRAVRRLLIKAVEYLDEIEAARACRMRVNTALAAARRANRRRKEVARIKNASS